MGDDNHFYIYDIITHDIIKSIPTNDISSNNDYTHGDIIVSPNNNQIAHISENYHIVIWSLDNIKKSYVIKNQYYNAKISYSTDSKKIAFSGKEKIKIIDTESGCIINSFICITKDPKKIDHNISDIYYLNENEIILVEKYVKYVKSEKSEKSIRKYYSEIKIFNATLGQYIKNILNCDYEIKSIRCTKKYIAVIGYGLYIELLNLETNNSKFLRAHTKYIKDIYFNHDGTKLASLSHDGTIIIWDVETGKILNIIPILYRHENGCTYVNDKNNVKNDNDDDFHYNNEYDNSHIRYNNNYGITLDRSNYPVYMCWTKYKNQILVSYNCSGTILIDYTTCEIIKCFKELKQINYHYITCQNKNIVDKINKIL